MHAAEALHDYAERLGKLVEEIKAMSDATEVAGAYVAVREQVDYLVEVMKDINKLRQHLQYTVVPDAFGRRGIRTLTTQDGYRVTVSPTISTAIEDREKAFEWLRDNGLSELITETVNASTLKAALRKMLEDDGIEPPAGTIRVNVGMQTSVTKVR